MVFKGTVMLTTIGYERADLSDFLNTLEEAGVEVLADIRDRAQSRRKGFSKTALSNALAERGISYVHFRDLGDPKEGREAARRGDLARFRKIFSQVMASPQAQDALAEVSKLSEDNNVCLLCYERDHRDCHRAIVASAVSKQSGIKPLHLRVRKFPRAA